MTDPVKRPLGIEATKFISEALSVGGSLSRAVSSSLDLQVGSVHSFALESVPASFLLKFTEGGKLDSESPKATARLKVGNLEGWASKILTTERILESEVRAFLSESPNNLVLIENSIAQASDAWLDRRRSSVVFLRDDRVVHFIDPQSLSKTKVTLMESRSTLLTPLFFVTLESQSENRDGETLEDSEVNRMVRNVQRISILGIYDGESHITWEKIIPKVNGEDRARI